ncbi:MAG: ubiquitin-conjugating enzyme E2 [Candidatus Hermodarchaeota archaeon]
MAQAMRSQQELSIAREAQLMYRRAPTFTPVGQNLRRWRGKIKGGPRSKEEFLVEIIVPPNFPAQPPVARMLMPTKHPRVDSESGAIHLRIVTQWQPHYHVYQVVNSIKGLFAREPPVPDETREAPKVKMPQEEEVLQQRYQQLEREVARLSKKVQDRDERLARMSAQIDTGSITDGEVTDEEELDALILPTDAREREQLELESEKLAIEDLLQNLEQKFDSAEINSTEYTKLYKRYKRRLYQIDKALEKYK